MRWAVLVDPSATPSAGAGSPNPPCTCESISCLSSPEAHERSASCISCTASHERGRRAASAHLGDGLDGERDGVEVGLHLKGEIDTLRDRYVRDRYVRDRYVKKGAAG